VALLDLREPTPLVSHLTGRAIFLFLKSCPWRYDHLDTAIKEACKWIHHLFMTALEADNLAMPTILECFVDLLNLLNSNEDLLHPEGESHDSKVHEV